MTDHYLISPLSYLDSHCTLNQSAILVSYALDLTKQDAVSSDRILSAAEGVARKWRYFAGRVSFDEVLDRFIVKLPIRELGPDYALVNFTEQTFAQDCTLTFPEALPNSCSPLEMFPESYVLSPHSPVALTDLASRQAPLVSIRTTCFANRQYVGLAISHVIVDGKGFGMWLRAFNAELNGEEWDVPAALEEVNAQDAAAARIAKESAGDPRADPKTATTHEGIAEGVQDGSKWNIARTIASILKDKYWYGIEFTGVFLGDEVVDALVRKVKDDVRRETEGREFVSTGDVLQAWLVKAAYADEPNHGSVSISNVVCTRDALGLAPRPGMTSAMLVSRYCPSPQTSSLSTLALFNRRRLLAVRTPQHVSAWLHWFASFRHSAEPFVLDLRGDSWVFSNQAQCNTANAVDWGSGKGKGYEYRCRLVPGMFSKPVFLNKVEGGWTAMGQMRRTRWASVMREADKLERGFKGEE